ncbi:hypothetical protein Cme02nite_41820 [Catellatospora methionotrophica]|uniref:Transcriptional regulator WhiB n=1 Tax=Catellatospora methionotrophica TaxID=121620 RepID=A0A8J3LJX3_9ACTN|nr:hypothetical protein Cme02nite_41820 [Catellatospora methionotrophica]
MTRARIPRPHEVAAARRDPRLVRAVRERHDNAWRTRGACQAVDPETFFPAPLEPADTAVQLCGRCPVSGACLAWALSVGDCHGVWGGTTARERRAMLVAWRTEEQQEEMPYTTYGPQPDLVVSAGQLAPPQRAAGVTRQLPRIPTQSRAELALCTLGEAERDTALQTLPLLTREHAHAA